MRKIKNIMENLSNLDEKQQILKLIQKYSQFLSLIGSFTSIESSGAVKGAQSQFSAITADFTLSIEQITSFDLQNEFVSVNQYIAQYAISVSATIALSVNLVGTNQLPQVLSGNVKVLIATRRV